MEGAVCDGGRSQACCVCHVVFVLPRRPERLESQVVTQIKVTLTLPGHRPLNLYPKFMSIHFSWKNRHHVFIKFIKGDVTQKAYESLRVSGGKQSLPNFSSLSGLA